MTFLKNKLYKKFFSIRILKRFYIERLGEPVFYNIVSFFVLIFGSISSKIKYDLIPRQPYAFSILEAAELAIALGYKEIYIIEFGVASGAGIMNMHSICESISDSYGISFKIIGFDTGEGMPPALDYRDHPEKYYEGDFKPVKKEFLEKNLPSNIKIYWGDIAKTVSIFQSEKNKNIPIGFVSLDLDYYSSTKNALKIFKFEPDSYLPYVKVYLDDINNLDHNSFCGELLAVSEFNIEQEFRKIERVEFLKEWRIFKNALWHKQIYHAYVLDHNQRTVHYNMNKRKPITLENPYI